MNKHLKGAILSLIVLTVLFVVIGSLTEAFNSLTSINLFFFALASILFILEIFVWVFSWGYLIKKHNIIRYRNLLAVGFSSFFGSLTPIQLGAEYLRSTRLKKYFGISYNESVAASLVNKGTKFLLLSIFASLVLYFYLIKLVFTGIELILLLGLLSGFMVVLLSALMFFLPLNKSIGLRIANFFKGFGKPEGLIFKIGLFFEKYTFYLHRVKKRHFVAVFFLSFLSFALEFLALTFTFYSLGINLQLEFILVLFVLIALLEKTPFLPRGIGLVELVGYSFLSFPLIAGKTMLSLSEIGAVLIAFDVVRLVIPTIASMLFSIVLGRSHYVIKFH